MRRFLAAVICLCFLILPASAWGPHTHTLITDRLFDGKDSEVIRTCEPYKSAFLAGSEIPDITVVYYYNEGGKNYRLTHNWNFQQDVMNQAQSMDEVCFAYGIAQHLISDGVVHEGLVPDKIRDAMMPNWILHPLLEKKYDSEVVRMHPDLVYRTPRMLDAMYGTKGDRYFTMIEKAIGDNPAINVRSDTLKLSYALGSFYETAYKPTGDAWMFKIYPFVDGLTNSVESYVPDSSLGSAQYWLERTVEQNTNVFNNWGTRYSISPHGFDKLNAADKDVGVYINLLTVLIGLIPIMIAYYTKQYLWVVISPITGVVFMVVVYVML